MITTTTKHIVATALSGTVQRKSSRSFLLTFAIEVNGIPRIVEVDVDKFEKRLAYKFINCHELLFSDAMVETNLRTAAVLAFAGELKKPLHIS